MPLRIRTVSDQLEGEFAQERAAALGRTGRALENALAALARFDAEGAAGSATAERGALRDSLVADASVALWSFAVQREACGLNDLRHVLRDYRVPREVVARMGVCRNEPARRQCRGLRGIV